jgi:4,5-DOPA dioxygenase extradiol
MTDSNSPTGAEGVEQFPSVFVSHGAPSLALDEDETAAFLRRLGAELGRPRAVLCVSAHWETDVVTLSAAERPETIHDFGGFGEELHRVRYDAPGAPDVAARAAELLKGSGVEARLSPTRGLDHGAWVPLSLMYPQRDVPVTQLSVLRRGDGAAHFQIGRALAPLRREGVLILGSGGAVHNLSGLRGDKLTPEWAAGFDAWLERKIEAGSVEGLLDYRNLAPHARLAHPTEEHLLPLFVALGAGGGDNPRGQSLHRGWTHGSLSMNAYLFGGSIGGDTGPRLSRPTAS